MITESLQGADGKGSVHIEDWSIAASANSWLSSPVSNGLRTGWQQLSADSREHGMGLIKHLGSFAFLD